MLMTMEHALVGWNAYLVVPLFGSANAGVALGTLGLGAVADPLPVAVGAGLALGQAVGHLRQRGHRRPDRVCPAAGRRQLGQLWGTSILCGIGFTISLFISALAFPDHPLLVEEAKLGILAGSAISAVLGYIVLRLVMPAPVRA